MFAVGVGLFLAAGFQSTALAIAQLAHAAFHLELGNWTSYAAFPALAAVFYFSFPRPPHTPPNWLALWSIPIPLVISAVEGALRGSPDLSSAVTYRAEALFWLCVTIPIGEELLFRGWVYSVAHRLWPRTFATATNPLSLAVWVSAAAFSLWHLQNLGRDPLLWVGFQLGYTLLAGLWLGWLRERLGIWVCILVHSLLNIAALLHW